VEFSIKKSQFSFRLFM